MIGNMQMLLNIPVWLAIIFVALALGAGMICGYFVDKKVLMKKLGKARSNAAKILEEAYAEAKTAKKESILQAQEEIHKLKLEADDEIKARRNDAQKLEDRLSQREDFLNKKEEQLDKRQETLEVSKQQIEAKKVEIDNIKDKQLELQEKITEELERVSGLTKEQAKDFLIKNYEIEAKKDAAKLVRNIEETAKEDADKKAKNIITLAIQKCACDHTRETTVA